MFVSQRCSSRKKMVVILLLFFTLTCVCGLPQVPLYQAEEDHNTTLRWDSPNKKDLSFINIHCLSTSTPAKYLFEMIGGDETSQDEQFSGRVHCDREALKEGRVWIHLFRLKPEDSGDYLCDMSIYDRVKRELENLCTEHFQLNVTSKGGITMATPEDTVCSSDPFVEINLEEPQWQLFTSQQSPSSVLPYSPFCFDSSSSSSSSSSS